MGLTPYTTQTSAVRRSHSARVSNKAMLSMHSEYNNETLKSASILQQDRARVKKSQSMKYQRHRQNSIKKCKQIVNCEEMGYLSPQEMNAESKCLLEKISDWSFDVFALEKASNGKALYHVTLDLFKHHNLISHFRLDMAKLSAFAKLVEEGYQSNPYHNATHAADVTQAMHCYITQAKIASHLKPIEILVALLSALTHDMDHPGVNQGFLIATDNHLANLYQKTSVLEKHHWKSAVGALRQTKLIEHLSEFEKNQIETEMRSLILATDMTRQHDFLSQLKSRVADDSLDMSSYADRHLIMQISLKCADISNPCRRWSTCKMWSERVCEEFFNQGDQERQLQLDISNLCDRYTCTVPKIQTGFIDFCVVPLLSQFESYLFPNSMLSEQLTNLRTNREIWQEKAETETLPAAAKRPESLTINCSDITDEDIPSPTAFNTSQSSFDFSCQDLIDFPVQSSQLSAEAQQSLHQALLDHVSGVQSRPTSRKPSLCKENDSHLSNLIDLIKLST